MKVLCPQCERLIALEVFRVEGPALIITCGKCGAETRVESVPATATATGNAPAPARPPSLPPRVSLESTSGGSNVVVLRTAGHEATQKAARAADEGPFTLPEGVCPKCIAPRATTPSCPYCGILFESFDEASVLPPKWLREEWVEVLRDWGNAPRHAQLRRKAQQTDALAAVGRLYRLRQAAVPEDPVAEEGRADVLRLAAAAMSFRPPQDDDVERRKKVVFGATLGLLALILVLGLLQLLRSS
ncbi:MAG: hypothetical protein Q8L48_36875 [Archangium sp.]|nr:hypothetical protein [Archangium sp.]